MDELSLLTKIKRVKAPPDFEHRVLVQLDVRKARQVRVRHLRLSFSGAFAALAVVFAVLNVFILPHRTGSKLPAVTRSLPFEMQINNRTIFKESIPIIESVDYRGEIRSLRDERPTIYILEQISETSDPNIIY